MEACLSEDEKKWRHVRVRVLRSEGMLGDGQKHVRVRVRIRAGRNGGILGWECKKMEAC